MTRPRCLLLLPLLLVALQTRLASAEEAECASTSAPYSGVDVSSPVLAKEEEYGVDVSFPIHKWEISTNYPWLPHNVDPANNPTPKKYQDMPIQPLGDRQKAYDEFLQGCKDHYGKKHNACNQTEKDRILMNRRQPQSMVNYTEFGIKKIRAPETLMTLLTKFWEDNKGLEYPEQWGTGNTYVNHWEMPSYMLSVENPQLKGGGSELKAMIWDAAVDSVREWTGQDLTTSSLYGIRVYKEGAVLAPHVDRLPLVSSCIINVAQDVDEPWPLEVYTHDGIARNITIEPGDMVLYESHSVVHGRPFPLKGRYFANVFIHFQPVLGADFGSMPSYIIPGSPEAKKWERENRNSDDLSVTGSTSIAHRAAQGGDVETLKDALDKDKALALAKDSNGWEPIHEASRGGHREVVELLLKNFGADVNSRTNFGDGGTPLYLAQKEGHSQLADWLESLGGIAIGPEL